MTTIGPMDSLSVIRHVYSQTIPETSPSFVARVLSKIDWNGPVPSYAPHLGSCAIWTGTFTDHNYGEISKGTRQEKKMKAHTAVWWVLKGEPPAGLMPDHLCRVTTCVHPEHIEWVTNRENLLRGFTVVSALADREVCDKGGHPLDGVRKDKGRLTRYCKECHRVRVAERRAAMKPTTRERMADKGEVGT